ncbi:MAG: hypothetical protein WC755_05360 [Candidatus Woesearchaeota archaeon]|jgi:hypothetical protein
METKNIIVGFFGIVLVVVIVLLILPKQSDVNNNLSKDANSFPEYKGDFWLTDLTFVDTFYTYSEKEPTYTLGDVIKLHSNLEVNDVSNKGYITINMYVLDSSGKIILTKLKYKSFTKEEVNNYASVEDFYFITTNDVSLTEGQYTLKYVVIDTDSLKEKSFEKKFNIVSSPFIMTEPILTEWKNFNVTYPFFYEFNNNSMFSIFYKIGVPSDNYNIIVGLKIIDNQSGKIVLNENIFDHISITKAELGGTYMSDSVDIDTSYFDGGTYIATITLTDLNLNASVEKHTAFLVG